MVRTSRRVASEGAGAPVESFRGSQAAGQERKEGKGSRTHKKNWRKKGGGGRKVGGGKKVRMLLSFFLFLRRQFSPSAPRVVSLRRTVAVATCDLAQKRTFFPDTPTLKHDETRVNELFMVEREKEEKRSVDIKCNNCCGTKEGFIQS